MNRSLALKNKEPAGGCKGIIARASASEGFTKYNDGSRAFFLRKSLRILKKKSCPGCEKCGWFYDCAPEVHLDDFPIEGFEEIQNGKLYRIWGTGDEDDFYLCVMPYSEEDQK